MIIILSNIWSQMLWNSNGILCIDHQANTVECWASSIPVKNKNQMTGIFLENLEGFNITTISKCV